MEMEPKPEVSQLRCCIACLKDESEVRVENSNDTIMTKIYNTLVQGEINQLGLPSINLCDFCKDTLLLVIEFQKQCLRSIESLKTKLDFNPEVILIKEEKIDVDEVVRETTETTKTSQKGEEERCKSTDTSSDEEADGGDAQSEEESETDESVKVEPKEKKKSNVIRRTRKNAEKAQKRYSCEQCDCSYVKPLELKRHIMKKHQGGSQCKYCRNVFLDKEEFKQHMKEEETKTRADPTVCCEQCGYTTKWKPGLRKHITKYHTPDQPKLICDICEKSYVIRSQFKHHFITKHMERAFQCSECGKKFSFNTDLKKHIRDFHTPEGALKGPNSIVKCKYCEKTMKNSSLRQHIQMVHRSFKKHRCSVCSVAFTRASVLKRHLLTHDPERTIPPKNDKNTSCTECGLSFKTKPDLTQHQITTHLDKEILERNYVSCKFCTEKLRPSSMQMHIIRKHIDARKFKCDQCEKAFNNSRGLRLHQYTHTGERPFNCNLCSSGYYQMESLRKHFERVHDIQYSMENIRRICGAVN